MLKSTIQDKTIVIENSFATINLNNQGRTSIQIDILELTNLIKKQQSIEPVISQLEAGIDEAIRGFINQLYDPKSDLFVSDNDLMYLFIREFDFLDAAEMSENYRKANILVQEFRENQKIYNQRLDDFISKVKARGGAIKFSHQLL